MALIGAPKKAQIEGTHSRPADLARDNACSELLKLHLNLPKPTFFGRVPINSISGFKNPQKSRFW